MKKRIISSVLLLSIIITSIIFGGTPVVYASENPLISCGSEKEKNVRKSYLVVNGTQIVNEGEDYENEATGEYIHWIDTRGVDKKFTFKIRYSITSKSFTINGTSVTVKASAYLTDDADNPLSCDDFKYSVSINGVYSRKLNFNIGGTQTGTISGLKKGGSYTVTISTGESMPGDGYGYLQGSGTIES